MSIAHGERCWVVSNPRCIEVNCSILSREPPYTSYVLKSLRWPFRGIPFTRPRRPYCSYDDPTTGRSILLPIYELSSIVGRTIAVTRLV